MKLYEGTFNWQGQSITLFTHARDRIRAFANFCRQLVKIVDYNYDYIWHYFMSNQRDGYIINERRKENEQR